ncbi:MAG TPA: OmpA family protein [Flavisolibacter sp.]|jgi:outer membrane protein OmpA-like peptidoglycan-associated protein|nr:OmpA family protein [Flavisolibacter sp.]
MKKIIFLLLFLPFVGAAQSGILNKVKQKVKDRAEQRVDEGIDKTLDKTEEEIAGKGKQKEPAKEEKAESLALKEAPAAPAFESYSRYDFVPGANMVYAEDFSQDVIGEFPLLWGTDNRGEVVTIKGQEGKWLRMFHTSEFVGPQLKTLPSNFTVEFDMVLTFPNEGYVYPNILLKLLQSNADDKDGRKYLGDVHSVSHAAMTISPGEEGSSTIALSSQFNGEEYFNGGQKALKKLDTYYGKPFHVAIWVQKSRLRMWINGEKIYDIPQAVSADMVFNRLALGVSSCYYEEEKVGAYISNIRIAEGLADARNKLMTEGRWVTHGILFDVASAKIKPESAGVLKEIADILKENVSLTIKIIGHTDSDGDDAKNIDLSKRRAATVKEALVKSFGVEASRMQTDGLGETKPLKENTTKEGKAQNRRVEFIKL